jgi:hypothetical protein
MAYYETCLITISMNEPFSIVPPPELVGQWQDESPEMQIADHVQYLIARAAQWGADQELEACGRWIEDQLCMPPDARADVITKLNGSRRPKPPSLKEQALALVEQHEEGWRPSPKDWDTIRRALEALDA